MTTPNNVPSNIGASGGTPNNPLAVANFLTQFAQGVNGWVSRTANAVNWLLQGGNFAQAQVPSANAISLTSNTVTSLCSTFLDAGTWDVTGSVSFVASGSCTIVIGSFNTIIADADVSLRFEIDNGATIGVAAGGAVPTQRFILTTASTVFLIVQANFSTGAVICCGNIQARQI
jgi:hypothetical protein